MLSLSLALALALVPIQSPVVPELVRDLDADAPPLVALSDSNPRPLAEFGAGLLLVADERPGLPALWFLNRTDGEFAQISPGIWGSPSTAAVLGSGRALVGVEEGAESARFLLATDGTLAGTDYLFPGDDARLVGGPVLHAGRAWFVIRPATGGLTYSLYSSDGTFAGTTLEQSFGLGINTFEEARLWSTGGKLFFTLPYTAQASFLNQPELWVLPAAGAPAVFLTGAESETPNQQIDRATAYEGNLWFVTDNPNESKRLLMSDGTPAGTQPLAGLDLAASSPPQFLARDSSNLWIVLQEQGQEQQLYRVASGTTALTPVPGALQPAPGFPSSALTGALLPDGRLVYRGYGLVQGSTFSSELEPWVTDGTPQGTFELADLSLAQVGSSPTGFTSFGAEVLFSADGPNGRELYTSDGTQPGTRLLADLFPGPGNSAPEFLLSAADAVYLSAENPVEGRELFSSQGLGSGVTLAANLAAEALTASSAPERLLRFGDRVFFAASLEDTGLEPYVTDGTEVGTISLGDLTPGVVGSNPQPMAVLGAFLIFTADTPAFGIEPWVTDGTPAGTQLLADLIPGPQSSLSTGYVRLGQRVYFAGRFGDLGTSKLFATDGTPGGTLAVLDVAPGYRIAGAGPKIAANLGRTLIFAGDIGPGATALQAFDPDLNQLLTIPQTQQGEDFEDPFDMTRVGDRVYFAARPPGSLHTLYSTDGTPAGTQRVFPDGTLNLGNSVQATQLTALGGSLLFIGREGNFGQEVWRTDGTFAGTQLLVDALPGFDFTPPFGLERVDDRAFFASREFTFPGEIQKLWVTDGTPAGTSPVPNADGPDFRWQASRSQRLGSTDQALVLASDVKSGFELQRSPAANPSLVPLPENNVGPPSSLDPSPPPFLLGSPAAVELAGSLLFASNDPVVGSELFSLDLDALGYGGAEVFGEGCSRSGDEPLIDWSGIVALGQTFQLELDLAEPGATAFALYSGGALPSDPLLDGCPVYLGAPKLLQFETVDGSGAASSTVLVPTQPQLLGLRLTLQWASTSATGPLLGVLETSNALELVLATAP